MKNLTKLKFIYKKCIYSGTTIYLKDKEITDTYCVCFSSNSASLGTVGASEFPGGEQG